MRALDCFLSGKHARAKPLIKREALACLLLFLRGKNKRSTRLSAEGLPCMLFFVKKAKALLSPVGGRCMRDAHDQARSARMVPIIFIKIFDFKSSCMLALLFFYMLVQSTRSCAKHKHDQALRC